MSRALLSLFSELLWWGLTLLTAAIVLWPLHGLVLRDYLLFNACLIAMTVQFFRYTLFVNQTFYLKPLVMKWLFSAINIALIAVIVVRMQTFLYDADNHDISIFMTDQAFKSLGGEDIHEWYRYFKKEFIFFAVSAFLLLFTFEMRLIGSLWKTFKN